MALICKFFLVVQYLVGSLKIPSDSSNNLIFSWPGKEALCFIFAIGHFLPFAVKFFSFNGNFNGKMAKNRFSGVQNGSQDVEMGVLGGYLYWKVVLEFWFGHPKCHFRYPPKSPKWVILGVERANKLDLYPELNFCSDFEHKVWSRFWSWSSGKIWSWGLASFFLLMFSRGYEVESWSRFWG